MARYVIRIDYRTGNTFGTHDDRDDVSLTWTDLAKAKEALARLRAFHEVETKYLGNERREKMAALPGYSSNMPEYYILFQDDNGVEHEQVKFWSGYFETLNRAEIVMVDGDNDMVYEP